MTIEQLLREKENVKERRLSWPEDKRKIEEALEPFGGAGEFYINFDHWEEAIDRALAAKGYKEKL